MNNEVLIYVGDPHVQPSNIKDCEQIIEMVIETQSKTKASYLVFGGDLFHTHAVLRLEVVNFWQKSLRQLAPLFKEIIAIAGNHDMAGDKEREGKMSALDVLKDIASNVIVVDKPYVSSIGGFLPYMSDHQKFIQSAKELKDKGVEVLFCHQTFDGSKYDNGFYAPDGIDQKLLPEFKEIVSGHIHTKQHVGKVFYPGTPKWDTLSDANEPKGIWINNGQMWGFVDISKKIEPITSVKVTPDTDLSTLTLTRRTTAELEGSSAWIAEVSRKLKGKCRLVARPNDTNSKKAWVGGGLSIWEYLEKSTIPCDKGLVKSYLEAICR